MNQHWQLPPINDILDDASLEIDQAKAREQVRLLERRLAELGVAAQVRNIHHGPRLTEFALKPGFDVKMAAITRLEKDLALVLSGNLVEIEQPKPDYPYLGIVVDSHRQPDVKLRWILESAAFARGGGALKVGLGLNKLGSPVVIDLTALPHLLIGGTTGSGKSSCLQAIIAGLACTYPPDALQFLLVDLARVELGHFDGLPHLIAPVVGQAKQALDTLDTIDGKIDQRYREFARVQARDITTYNQKVRQAGRSPLPYLVIAIDNVFDLLLNVPVVVGQIITRMAQRARGAGVHLILATPRARSEAISGTLKANFPGRIAFKVTDRAESQLILDAAGAEKLLGQGDMLYKAPNTTSLQRVQGVHVSEQEVERLVDFWRRG
jgi:S-DNA-T family DNA segregation ATPase FtsK/SpoIIIE